MWDNFTNWLSRRWQDIQAFFRGETRTVPGNVRGRVYEKKPGKPGQSSAEPEAKLTMRIERADGSVEIRQVSAEVEKING